MSSQSSFRPHGLITSDGLERNYGRAKISAYPREAETVELLENIFNKELFSNQDDVTVNSYQTSRYAYFYTKNKCKFIIKYFDNEQNQAAKILCFAEHKMDYNETSRLRNFEKDVTKFCREYLNGQTTQKFVYACTASSTRLRIWKYFRGDYSLTGLWGGYGLSADYLSYLDVGDDDSSRRIRQAFHQITSPPSASENEQTTNLYPGKSVYMPATREGTNKASSATMPFTAKGEETSSSTTSRQVDTWMWYGKDKKPFRTFKYQGEKINTNLKDWRKVKSSSFFKKRLIYQKDGYDVWTEFFALSN